MSTKVPPYSAYVFVVDSGAPAATSRTKKWGAREPLPKDCSQFWSCGCQHNGRKSPNIIQTYIVSWRELRFSMLLGPQ